MDKKDKQQLSESDIRAMFITPALIEAGWDKTTQIRREVPLTPGAVVVRGNMAARRKSKKFPDYVLYWKQGLPIAVLEAKNNTYSISSGMQQALGYAEILNVPSAYSSNGDGFAEHNKTATDNQNKTATDNQDIETEFDLTDFPSPNELWQRYQQFHGIEAEQHALISQPYYDDGSSKQPRYYQSIAINQVIERIAQGQKRLLLVMATGTGKTYTTFQIIWRLWKAKAAKRILFLVDRNILADQTLVNDFKPFGSVMTKIKNRTIDPSYEIYLGLYQAMTGQEESQKIYKTVSPDFFDLIVIDECHRGSAKDDSAWREILEYFDNAIQLGLTATPRETEYASNIDYFGEPIYQYSLKQGIQDGFLAPYKVVRIDLDKDLLGWTPPPNMRDDLGNKIEFRKYNQSDMDRILILNQRTKRVAERVMQYLKATDPFAKTIIFCEDINHAERMRVAIVNAAGQLAKDNSKYVMRITGDNAEGKAELDNFIDPESHYPVIATTSELMTTGVDAKTCKLIVLDKTIKSMTMFKQIIGRGTRIEEEHNKFFFTIIDFKKATLLFRDSEFDSDPVQVYEPSVSDSPVPPEPEIDNDEIKDSSIDKIQGANKVYVSGVEVSILAERVEYRDTDGKMVTESYRDYSRKHIRQEYVSMDNFLRRWHKADKKIAIIETLQEYGIELDKLAQEVGADYSDFDLICHIAFDQTPLTRAERAKQVKKRDVFSRYNTQARAVIDALLDKYADKGIVSIEDRKVLKLQPFDQIGTPVEIIKNVFGGKKYYEMAVEELKQAIYK
ncbi:EcoAI/FtnUII family type I restriction enzme subunit R [Candidatus Albibeggiatoa sp. nov. BB20]|uniref:EcoAI/FtnUII family type I restriction enzme subunit R n=1 Tax=Candidatus Albibeggiatoa sp. nov. BB20 TaxID=3162723 RepID=UPI003365A8AF